ncbi:Uncharacterised protein [Paucimonas lemoignei]|nr:Uncharacterised protein [Paucimonas lemoignei]
MALHSVRVVRHFRLPSQSTIGVSSLSKAIRRKSRRQYLCGTDTDIGNEIRHIKDRLVVVWWYARCHKNDDAQSIPYVDVVFRYLGKHDVPAGFTVAKIAVSHLGSFRVGTMWLNGECVGETNFGKKEKLSVDFSDGSWKYVYLTDHPSTEYELAKFQHDAPVDRSYTPKALSHLMSFKLSDTKNLLIPCAEFLARCYGSTSDMARILATYAWDDVMTKLYAAKPKSEPESETGIWVVRPHPSVPDDDALFLASLQHDPYAAASARSIYSQLDVAREKNIKRVSLKVRPWFQGSAKVECIGRWINNNTTFLCLEVTGMSEPRDHIYEIIRQKYTEKDVENGVLLTIPVQPVRQISDEQNSLVVTSEEEPDKDATVRKKRNPGFRILGERCSFIQTTEELSFRDKKIVTVRRREHARYATGDGHGSGKEIGGIRFTSERFTGSGGILQQVWDELTRIKNMRPDFSDLAWYGESTGFKSDDCEFQLQSLRPFDPASPPSDRDRRWLRFPDNKPAVRAALILRIIVAERSFYLLELQRKLIRKGGVSQEEQVSGLLIEISSPEEVVPAIEAICDKIRFRKGKFSGLNTLAPYSHYIFRHYRKENIFLANTTLTAAFRELNLTL